MKQLWTILIALALLGGACGSSDDVTVAQGDDGSARGAAATPSDDPRVAEIKALITSDETFPITDDEADCAATRLVNDLPSETIDAMLADPGGDISEMDAPDQAFAAIDAMLDCVDLERAMVEAMVDEGTPLDQAECIADAFGEDEIRGFMELSSLPEDQIDESAAMEIIGKMFEIGSTCGLDMG